MVIGTLAVDLVQRRGAWAGWGWVQFRVSWLFFLFLFWLFVR